MEDQIEEAYPWKSAADIMPFIMKDMYERTMKNRPLNPQEEISYQEALNVYYENYTKAGVLKKNQRFIDNGERYVIKKRLETIQD